MASPKGPSRRAQGPGRRRCWLAPGLLLGLGLGVAASAAACGPGAPAPQAEGAEKLQSSKVDAPPPPPPPPPLAPVEHLRVQVQASYPHDRQAFTQGLVWDGGKLWESTGQYGRSTLRQVELESGQVLRQIVLPRSLFAEGLAQVGEELLQLTWREGKALRWSAESLEPQGEHLYPGEGWGLCFDGQRLVMSDGSDLLTFRDPATFDVLGQVPVTLEGRPVGSLNELECVAGAVYANVWTSEQLVRIDPASGRVTALVDASGLLTAEESRGVDVLNGIAYRPDTGTFLLTGKLWPRLFEVELVPVGP